MPFGHCRRKFPLFHLVLLCLHNQAVANLITIFFASESNPQFCALLKTALLNKQDVHILGWNLKSSGERKVMVRGTSRDIVQVTPLLVSSYVCSLDEETIVFGSDAYDTLFSSQSSPQDLLDTFSMFESDFIWSAEANMWPKYSELPVIVKRFYDGRKHADPYRYLNYGGWIGTAKTACKVLELCARQLSKCTLCRCARRGGCKSPKQDQGAAHVVYASKWRRYNIVLDHEQVIFHPAYPRCKRLRVNEFGHVRVENFSNSTHMYHFNGASKYRSGCEGYYKSGWFANIGKPPGFDDSVTFVGNKKELHVLSASNICPYIWWTNFTWIEPNKGQEMKWKINVKDKVFRHKHF